MELVLKKGTELFHSTGEPFDEESLRGGGYDRILWTTVDSAISQTYIPVAGSSIIGVNTSDFVTPSKDNYIINFQKKHGIEFKNVVWGNNRYADSYSFEKSPFKDIDKLYNDNKLQSYDDTFKMKYERINNILEDELGYKPFRREEHTKDHSWKFKLQGENIMPADYKMKGRLFILVPTQDLKIYDMTYGGSIEGDLTDLDYHKLEFFNKLMEKGYDGVKINDFAQSVDQENFGHHSIGLFRSAITKLDKEIVQDVVHPELDSHYQTRDWRSSEYKKHRGINEIRKFIRKILSENNILG